MAETRLRHERMLLRYTLDSISGKDLSVRLDLPLHMGEEYPLSFLRARSPSRDWEYFERCFDEDPTVISYRLVLDNGEKRVYRVVLNDEEAEVFSPEAGALGIRIVGAWDNDGYWTGQLVSPTRENYAEWVAYCKERGAEVCTESLYSQTSGDLVDYTGLTESQIEALRVALEMGYFDEPKQATLEEVGAELELSPSACGRLIRRGNKRLIESSLREVDDW